MLKCIARRRRPLSALSSPISHCSSNSGSGSFSTSSTSSSSSSRANAANNSQKSKHSAVNLKDSRSVLNVLLRKNNTADGVPPRSGKPADTRQHLLILQSARSKDFRALETLLAESQQLALMSSSGDATSTSVDWNELIGIILTEHGDVDFTAALLIKFVYPLSVPPRIDQEWYSHIFQTLVDRCQWLPAAHVARLMVRSGAEFPSVTSLREVTGPLFKSLEGVLLVLELLEDVVRNRRMDLCPMFPYQKGRRSSLEGAGLRASGKAFRREVIPAEALSAVHKACVDQAVTHGWVALPLVKMLVVVTLSAGHEQLTGQFMTDMVEAISNRAKGDMMASLKIPTPTSKLAEPFSKTMVRLLIAFNEGIQQGLFDKFNFNAYLIQSSVDETMLRLLARVMGHEGFRPEDSQLDCSALLSVYWTTCFRMRVPHTTRLYNTVQTAPTEPVKCDDEQSVTWTAERSTATVTASDNREHMKKDTFVITNVERRIVNAYNDLVAFINATDTQQTQLVLSGHCERRLYRLLAEELGVRHAIIISPTDAPEKSQPLEPSPLPLNDHNPSDDQHSTGHRRYFLRLSKQPSDNHPQQPFKPPSIVDILRKDASRGRNRYFDGTPPHWDELVAPLLDRMDPRGVKQIVGRLLGYASHTDPSPEWALMLVDVLRRRNVRLPRGSLSRVMAMSSQRLDVVSQVELMHLAQIEASEFKELYNHNAGIGFPHSSANVNATGYLQKSSNNHHAGSFNHRNSGDHLKPPPAISTLDSIRFFGYNWNMVDAASSGPLPVGAWSVPASSAAAIYDPDSDEKIPYNISNGINNTDNNRVGFVSQAIFGRRENESYLDAICAMSSRQIIARTQNRSNYCDESSSKRHGNGINNSNSNSFNNAGSDFEHSKEGDWQHSYSGMQPHWQIMSDVVTLDTAGSYVPASVNPFKDIDRVDTLSVLCWQSACHDCWKPAMSPYVIETKTVLFSEIVQFMTDYGTELNSHIIKEFIRFLAAADATSPTLYRLLKSIYANPKFHVGRTENAVLARIALRSALTRPSPMSFYLKQTASNYLVVPDQVLSEMMEDLESDYLLALGDDFMAQLRVAWGLVKRHRGQHQAYRLLTSALQDPKMRMVLVQHRDDQLREVILNMAVYVGSVMSCQYKECREAYMLVYKVYELMIEARQFDLSQPNKRVETYRNRSQQDEGTLRKPDE